jgi:iron complex outermembrane recepter protein
MNLRRRAVVAVFLGCLPFAAVGDPETEPSLGTIPVGEAQPEPGRATPLDPIVVTGSRIRRTDYEIAQPVFTITREDIERSGLSDLSQLLRQIPAAGNAGYTAQNQARYTTGGETSLDLRNLGDRRTLLLVNGRRWVSGLVPERPSVVDLNTIPASIIERVEVLKDGASAIYGSDAIAGVVNVITRRDFTGWDLSSQVGGYLSEGDGQKQHQSLSWGQVWPQASVYANLSFTEERAAYARNRAFTASPWPEAGVTRGYPFPPNGRFLFFPTSNNAALYQCENLQGGIAAGAAGGGTFGDTVRPVATQATVVPAGIVLCDLTLRQGAEGGSPGDYRVWDAENPDDYYNHFDDALLQQPSQRTAFFTTLTRRLADDVELGLEVLYNSRRSSAVANPVPVFGGNLVRRDAGYPASNTNNPFQQDIGIDSSCGGDPDSDTCTGLGIGSGLWILLPTGEQRLLWGWSNRADAWRAAAALNGESTALRHPLTWEAGAESSTLPRFDRVKLATSAADCGPDCVPLNVFAGPAGITRGALDYILFTTIQKNRGEQRMAYATASTNFDLPSGWLDGPLAVAGGLEFRHDRFTSIPDPVNQAGLTLNLQMLPTHGATTAREAFLELGIPLLSGWPAARALDLTVAARHSRYPLFSPVFTYKSGLLWKPVDDLILRGTYSTGLRAPSVGELYFGQSQGYDLIHDPCVDPSPQAAENCDADGVIPGVAENSFVVPYTVWSGNPGLRPEASRNLTYGLVYSPRFIPDLNLYLDAYRITVEDYIAIGLVTAQFYLDSCYEVPAEERTYCDRVHRRNGQGLHYVDNPYLNLSRVSTEGVDGGFDYGLALPRALGRVEWSIDGSYLQAYEYARPRPGQADDVTQWVGRSDLLTGWPRWKASSRLAWRQGRFTVSWLTRMAYKMTERCGDDRAPAFSSLGLCTVNSPAVADDLSTEEDEGREDASLNVWKTIFYHSAQVAYGLDAYGAYVVVGINNVLDQDPVRSYGIAGNYWYNYDSQHYETPGRFGYVRVGFGF